MTGARSIPADPLHKHLATSFGRVALRCATVLAFTFLLAPIAVIIPIAFSSGTFLRSPMPRLSLRWFEALMVPYPWLLALKNSFIIALAVTVLSSVLGTLAAYGFDRMQWRYKSVLAAFLVAPMVVPVFFASMGLIGSLAGVILAHTVIAVPIVFVTITATLKGFDHNLVRAASSLGAAPTRAFLSIVLPLLAPGVLAGAIFAFITSFDEVVIALFLTGPEQITLPRQLYSGLRNQLDPSIVAVAVLLMAFTILLLLALELFQSRTVKRRRRQ